jgi:hypothetical protein
LHIQKINWRLDILDEELAQVADGNDIDIDSSSGKYYRKANGAMIFRKLSDFNIN